MKSTWVTPQATPKTETLRAGRRWVVRIPFTNSRDDLIALLKEQPYIKPKAACRELGWSPQKLAGVMKTSKGEIVYGLIFVPPKEDAS